MKKISWFFIAGVLTLVIKFSIDLGKNSLNRQVQERNNSLATIAEVDKKISKVTGSSFSAKEKSFKTPDFAITNKKNAQRKQKRKPANVEIQLAQETPLQNSDWGDLYFSHNTFLVQNTQQNRERYPEGEEYLGNWQVYGDITEGKPAGSYFLVTGPGGSFFSKGLLYATCLSDEGCDTLFEGGEVYSYREEIRSISWHFDRYQDLLQAYQEALNNPYLRSVSIELLNSPRGAR